MNNDKPTTEDQERQINRASIIQAVQTPLGFFALVVLTVEVIFGTVAAISKGLDRTYLIVGMLILIFLLVAIVAFLAIFRPESLSGKRPEKFQLPGSISSLPLPEVICLRKPKILCISASNLAKLTKVEQDIKILKTRSYYFETESNLTSQHLTSLVSQNKFDIIHFQGHVESHSGDLIFNSKNSLSSEGFTKIIEISKAHLVLLASCNSVDLAARLSRITNMIAATTNLSTDQFTKWAELFYKLLSQGQSLSRSYDIATVITKAPMVLLMKQDITFEKF
jgi:hypothetical protein